MRDLPSSAVADQGPVKALRAVVAVPRGEVMADVEAIRLRHDPLAARLPAHVTLVFPFDSDIGDDALRSHVERSVASASPFALRLGRIIPLDDLHLGVTITTGSGSIVELHEQLYTGPLADHRSAVHRFVPHVTIGRFGQRSAMETASRELPSIELMIDSIVTTVTIWELTPGAVQATDIPLT
jgi:2'-5' RNA ligase